VHGCKTHLAQKKLSFRSHGCKAGIDVVGRTRSACEGKVPDEERTFDQKRAESVTVIHQDQVPPRRRSVKASGFRLPSALLLVLAALTGCDPSSPMTGDLRFGQVGEIQIEVRSPLGRSSTSGPVSIQEGALFETLRWGSNGGWTLAERVTYQGVIGSETIKRSRLNPGDLTQEYLSLIQQLTETFGLRLINDVPQDLVPNCGAGELTGLPTQVTVTINDEVRGESATWVRCSRGFLLSGDPATGIAPGLAGPDAEASRVVTAAQLTRFFTLGESMPSTYVGTLPFSTLDRGEGLGDGPATSRVFRGVSGQLPEEFPEFWATLAGGDAPLPDVNWSNQMVVLVAAGPRQEAGETIQIRRIVDIGPVVRVETVERVPGDFCSPAERRIYPFHVVVLPRFTHPVEFATSDVERVPCGV